MSYGSHFPPIHQYYVDGANIVIPHTSSSQVATGGVYILNSPNSTTSVQISDSQITGSVTANTGIAMIDRRWMYIYIKAGQWIRASAASSTLTPLKAA